MESAVERSASHCNLAFGLQSSMRSLVGVLAIPTNFSITRWLWRVVIRTIFPMTRKRLHGAGRSVKNLIPRMRRDQNQLFLRPSLPLFALRTHAFFGSMLRWTLRHNIHGALETRPCVGN